MGTAEDIRKKAEEYQEYTAENLSSMVRIPSLSCEEEKVIKEIRRQCEEAGFDEVRIDGLGNCICRIGRGNKILAFDAHIDTVDTGILDQWDENPYSGTVRDGWVNGRGTVDQEGGAAAMITAGRILKETGWEGDFTLYFTFTIMEEDCDGLCWKYIIEEEGIRPDFAVITEPTNLRITRGHRGRMEMEIFYTGRSAHGSAPERGDNAVYKAARGILNVEELHERLKTDPFLGKGSIAVSRVASNGPSLCAVPDSSSFYVDRRLTWGETLESAVKEVEDAAGKEGRVTVPEYDRPSYKGTVFTQEKYFPTWKIPEDHSLVQQGRETFVRLFRQEPEIDKWTFSTNAVSICGRFGIPCIGFGPGEESYAHAPNERVQIEHLVKASAFYALLPFTMEERTDG